MTVERNDQFIEPADEVSALRRGYEPHEQETPSFVWIRVGAKVALDEFRL